MPSYQLMKDAADPDVLIRTGWNGPVQGYPNRIPPWTPADFRAFPAGVMRTSVRSESVWAAICREIDVEAGAATPSDVPGFILAREDHGHHDAGVYVDLDGWPAVQGQLELAGIGPGRVRVRIAHWTGVPELIQLPGWGPVWAHQYRNWEAAGYDDNAVFGARDWSR
jgi:hypothetical protein